MKRRSLLWSIAAVLLLAVLALIGDNVADYRKFGRAVTHATNLSNIELEALGDFSRTFPKGEFHYFRGSEIPEKLVILDPKSVLIDEGYIGIKLYELGEILLYLDIHTTSLNQSIRLETNQDGHLLSNALWWRDPSLAKSLSPSERLVTIRFNTREWIVLPKEILVLYRGSDSGCEDEIIAVEALSPTDFNFLQRTVNAIPHEIRGKHFHPTKVRNAQHFSVNFASDGAEDKDDIVICNTWIETLDPLTDAVSRFGPKAYPITYKTVVSSLTAINEPPIVAMSNQKHWNQRHTGPRTPWWCVWRFCVESPLKITVRNRPIFE